VFEKGVGIKIKVYLFGSLKLMKLYIYILIDLTFLFWNHLNKDNFFIFETLKTKPSTVFSTNFQNVK